MFQKETIPVSETSRFPLFKNEIVSVSEGDCLCRYCSGLVIIGSRKEIISLPKVLIKPEREPPERERERNNFFLEQRRTVCL
jgi:hypothetical protein